jgi:hypothetical protein
MTPDMLLILLQEGEKKLLISLLTKPMRPLYLAPGYSS